MTVTNVSKDPAAATMAVTAEFDASTEAVWQLWADPRLLERWWGPPTYPATMVDHDLVAGGRAAYYMTRPHGARPDVLLHDQPRGSAPPRPLVGARGRPAQADPARGPLRRCRRCRRPGA